MIARKTTSSDGSYNSKTDPIREDLESGIIWDALPDDLIAANEEGMNSLRAKDRDSVGSIKDDSLVNSSKFVLQFT